MFVQKMIEAVPRSTNQRTNYLYALVCVFLGIGFMKLGAAIGNSLVTCLFGWLNPAILQALLFTLDPIFMSLLGFSGVVLLVLLWVRFVERRSIIDLGFYRNKAGAELLKGLFLGVVLMSTIVGLLLVTSSMSLDGTYFTKDNILSFVLILPFWFLQSGAEELVTRGWLLPVVARRVNLPIAVAVSSLLFAFLHIGNPSVTWIALLNIALFGLFASLYVLKTGNIWGITAIHTMWNAMQGSFFGLPVSGLSVVYSPMRFQVTQVSEWLSGGYFGPEGSLIVSVVLLIGILYLVLNTIKERP